jgi:hypothetical protein
MQGKYLITTDAWFYGADGKQYKSVWGIVEIVSDAILGIKTNVRSSNWFAKVSGEKNHVIIAGCQIHYAVKTDEKPNIGLTADYTIEVGEVKNYNRPTSIYVVE